MLRLHGWGRAHRLVLLRHRPAREPAAAEREAGQLRLPASRSSLRASASSTRSSFW